MAEGLILPDSMRGVLTTKRALEAVASDKNQSENMRRSARSCLGPLNGVLAQYLSENGGLA